MDWKGLGQGIIANAIWWVGFAVLSAIVAGFAKFLAMPWADTIIYGLVVAVAVFLLFAQISILVVLLVMTRSQTMV